MQIEIFLLRTSNTDARVMSWVMDTMAMLSGHGSKVLSPASRWRSAAARVILAQPRLGSSSYVRAIAAVMGIDLAGSRCVVQGYGKVGAPLVYLLTSLGVRVVAVSDIGGAVHNPAGLEPAALSAHVGLTGTVAGFAQADPIDPADLFAADCEIAIPAALGGTITADVAKRCVAKVIVEAANGPTTPEADEILGANGIIVVPDVLANAGGVVASYFEWAQDRAGYAWDEETVSLRLRATMERAFQDTHELSEKLHVSLRRAAVALGLERVAEATRLRGLFP